MVPVRVPDGMARGGGGVSIRANTELAQGSMWEVETMSVGLKIQQNWVKDSAGNRGDGENGIIQK